MGEGDKEGIGALVFEEPGSLELYLQVLYLFND